MNAIAGFVALRAERDARSACITMLDAQTSYGPDDRKLWWEPGVAVGRNLYQLLPEDLHDHQPLIGGGEVMVADLRLDNREEVAERLGPLSADLASKSDADVLLAAFDRFRSAALDIINGDFAVAIWDRYRRHLMLARDPLGQRPLFFTRQPGYVAFASVPSALHALGLPRSIDSQHLAEFIGLVPPAGPSTFYEGIHRVEPGHVVTLSASGVSSRRYWPGRREELRLPSFDDYREAFRAELDRAVRVRLRGADRIVATHLSSGWDSSAVTATAARIGAELDVLAFTAVPRPGATASAMMRRMPDEGALAGETAAMHPNIEHVLVPGAAQSPLARLDEYVHLYQRPLATLCNQVWLTDIREQARLRGARILLTGEVGNWTISASAPQLLADFLRERRWSTWFREASSAARTGRARLRGVAASSFGPWLPQPVWDLFRSFSSRPETDVFAALHPDMKGRISDLREERSAGLARRPKDRYDDTIRGLSGYDFGLLRKGTLAGWGVDERDPTGDRRLIEFCLSLPTEMLLKDGVRRPLARAALEDRLPTAVLDEQRKGYQAADWYEGIARHRGEVARLLDLFGESETARGVIDVDLLRAWMRDFPSDGWSDVLVMARYRVALLVALSAGHFVLSASRPVS